ncbi:MAG: hypothetical protein K1X79_09375 [Oligoflexia bacterium]|nr:hypothetical protein [Oligoflexia bacterium]
MSDVGYQRHEKENPVISWISRMLTLLLFGYVSILLGYTVMMTALYRPEGVAESTRLRRLEIVETVLLEGLHTSLGKFAKDVPWPNGLFMARLKSKVPAYSPVVVHSLVGTFVFAAIGYLGGRMMLSTSMLLLPLALFPQTLGFLQSEIYRLVPLNVIPITIVVGSQLAACYAFALWGKWSRQG